MAHPIGAKFNAGPEIKALTAAATLTIEESGTIVTLGTAGGFAVTLPAVADAAGCSYRFVVKVAPTTAYTVVTASSENKIQGQVCSAEDAAGSVSTAAASDTVTFVANKAIIGDYVDLVCDGVYWYASGMCNVQDGITTTQAS
jgi:hypothetical protein